MRAGSKQKIRYGFRNPGGKHRRFRERLAAYRAAHGPRRPIPRAAVPSFFTLMNLFSGFVSLTMASQGQFGYACWLIVLASFFDVLDGMMARLTKSNSLFGVELDSLSDIVSFGIAPSFIVYLFGLHEFGMLGLVVSALPALCGAIRLARFNVTFSGEKTDYFVGLPIPGQAIILAGLILNFQSATWFKEMSMNNMSLLIPIVSLLSILMVSSIKFDAIPKPSPQYIRQHPRKFIIYSIGLLIILFLQQVGLLFVLTVYLMYCIGRAIYNLVYTVLSFPVESESEPRGNYIENIRSEDGVSSGSIERIQKREN